MSTIQKSTTNPAQETEPSALATPEEYVQRLRELRARLPKPESVTAPSSLRSRLAHVDADFVHATINAAGTTEEVQAMLGRTDEDLRQETEASNRWTAAADEARALLKEITDANTVRRQRIGLAAMQTYNVCQQLARDQRYAPRLAAHIAEMRRLNKFGRVRQKPAEPAAAATQPVKQ